ncbi:hypothetical protein PO909_000508 [Leuciscus waleckii]
MADKCDLCLRGLIILSSLLTELCIDTHRSYCIIPDTGHSVTQTSDDEELSSY